MLTTLVNVGGKYRVGALAPGPLAHQSASFTPAFYVAVAVAAVYSLAAGRAMNHVDLNQKLRL